MELSKNTRYILAGIVSLLFSILIVNALIAGTKHSQENILITIDGYTMTLQEGIDNNYLRQGASSPTSSLTTSIASGHDASQVWVSVNGVESTLQDAINGAGLAGSTSVPYNGSINPGHLASEIEISVGGIPTTLQNAIDSGEFCVVTTYAYSDWSVCGTCSVTCGGGTCTKTRTCGKYANAVFVENVACSYCGGVCSDSTTTCNTQACGVTCGAWNVGHTCEGTTVHSSGSLYGDTCKIWCEQFSDTRCVNYDTIGLDDCACTNKATDHPEGGKSSAICS